MPGKGHKHSEKWDSCFEQLKKTGKSKDAASAICAAAEKKGFGESFVLRPEDFDLDTAAREELLESGTAYLLFDNDTIVEIKKSALGNLPVNQMPEDESPDEDSEDDEEAEDVGVTDNKPFPPKKKTKESYQAMRESLGKVASQHELVDVYENYAVVTAPNADGDYRLYRAPFELDGEVPIFESVDAWKEIEIDYVPDSTPLSEPIENTVEYSGEDVVTEFKQSGYELTDVYPGYVVALKEGNKYRFNFAYSDGKIVFSNDATPILENAVAYTGEQVVEAFQEKGFDFELTDVFEGYVITKAVDGTRYRFNYVVNDDKVVFEETAIPVQPVLTTVRVLELSENPKLKTKEIIVEATTDATKLRTLFFSEGLNLKESVVDRKQGVIDVTLIRPGWSLNGRYYSPKVLQGSLKVWDGIKAYGNHPTVTESKELPERSIWDQVGYYTNPRWEDNKVKATLKLVGDVEKKEHILDWAEESARTGMPLMGLSINAVGKTSMGMAEGRKGVIVEDIAAGSSVDVVTTPSAGGSFDRLLASDDGFTNLLLQNLEYDEWREARPDFFRRLQKEMKVARKEELENSALQEALTLKENLKGKEGELTKAREQVNRTEAKLNEVRRELDAVKLEIFVDQKLQESKLPNDWVSSLRPKLLEAGRDNVDEMITEEKKKFFGIKSPIMVRGAGPNQDLENRNRVAESLGVGVLPLPFERPEEYQVRKEKLAGKSSGSK